MGEEELTANSTSAVCMCWACEFVRQREDESEKERGREKYIQKHT